MLRSGSDLGLQDVDLEAETCRDRLLALRGQFRKMEETVASMKRYKAKIDQLKQENANVKLSYEANLQKYCSHISALERDNILLRNHAKKMETQIHGKGDDRDKSRLLLERLKMVETDNSSLVLENEQQRQHYEKCLDDIANQVVQALLAQKTLREECLKLQSRVEDLEMQNRHLMVMFKQKMKLSSDLMPQVAPSSKGSNEDSTSKSCQALSQREINGINVNNTMDDLQSLKDEWMRLSASPPGKRYLSEQKLKSISVHHPHLTSSLSLRTAAGTAKSPARPTANLAGKRAKFKESGRRTRSLEHTLPSKPSWEKITDACDEELGQPFHSIDESYVPVLPFKRFPSADDIRQLGPDVDLPSPQPAPVGKPTCTNYLSSDQSPAAFSTNKLKHKLLTNLYKDFPDLFIQHLADNSGIYPPKPAQNWFKPERQRFSSLSRFSMTSPLTQCSISPNKTNKKQSQQSSSQTSQRELYDKQVAQSDRLSDELKRSRQYASVTNDQGPFYYYDYSDDDSDCRPVYKDFSLASAVSFNELLDSTDQEAAIDDDVFIDGPTVCSSPKKISNNKEIGLNASCNGSVAASTVSVASNNGPVLSSSETIVSTNGTVVCKERSPACTNGTVSSSIKLSVSTSGAVASSAAYVAAINGRTSSTGDAATCDTQVDSRHRSDSTGSSRSRCQLSEGTSAPLSRKTSSLRQPGSKKKDATRGTETVQKAATTSVDASHNGAHKRSSQSSANKASVPAHNGTEPGRGKPSKNADPSTANSVTTIHGCSDKLDPSTSSQTSTEKISSGTKCKPPSFLASRGQVVTSSDPFPSNERVTRVVNRDSAGSRLASNGDNPRETKQLTRPGQLILAPEEKNFIFQGFSSASSTSSEDKSPMKIFESKQNCDMRSSVIEVRKDGTFVHAMRSIGDSSSESSKSVSASPSSPVKSPSKIASTVDNKATKIQTPETRAVHRIAADKRGQQYNCPADGNRNITVGFIFQSQNFPERTDLNIFKKAAHNSKTELNNKNPDKCQEGESQAQTKCQSSDSSFENLRVERSGSKDDGYSTMSSDIHPEILERFSDTLTRKQSTADPDHPIYGTKGLITDTYVLQNSSRRNSDPTVNTQDRSFDLTSDPDSALETSVHSTAEMVTSSSSQVSTSSSDFPLSPCSANVSKMSKLFDVDGGKLRLVRAGVINPPKDKDTSASSLSKISTSSVSPLSPNSFVPSCYQAPESPRRLAHEFHKSTTVVSPGSSATFRKLSPSSPKHLNKSFGGFSLKQKEQATGIPVSLLQRKSLDTKLPSLAKPLITQSAVSDDQSRGPKGVATPHAVKVKSLSLPKVRTVENVDKSLPAKPQNGTLDVKSETASRNKIRSENKNTSAPQSKKQVESAPQSKKQVESAPQPKKQVESAPQPKKQVESAHQPKKQVESAPQSKKQVESAPQSKKQVESAPQSKKQVETALQLKRQVETAPQSKKQVESVNAADVDVADNREKSSADHQTASKESTKQPPPISYASSTSNSSTIVPSGSKVSGQHHEKKAASTSSPPQAVGNNCTTGTITSTTTPEPCKAPKSAHKVCPQGSKTINQIAALAKPLHSSSRESETNGESTIYLPSRPSNLATSALPSTDSALRTSLFHGDGTSNMLVSKSQLRNIQQSRRANQEKSVLASSRMTPRQCSRILVTNSGFQLLSDSENTEDDHSALTMGPLTAGDITNNNQLRDGAISNYNNVTNIQHTSCNVQTSNTPATNVPLRQRTPNLAASHHSKAIVSENTNCPHSQTSPSAEDTRDLQSSTAIAAHANLHHHHHAARHISSSLSSNTPPKISNRTQCLPRSRSESDLIVKPKTRSFSGHGLFATWDCGKVLERCTSDMEMMDPNTCSRRSPHRRGYQTGHRRPSLPGHQRRHHYISPAPSPPSSFVFPSLHPQRHLYHSEEPRFISLKYVQLKQPNELQLEDKLATYCEFLSSSQLDFTSDESPRTDVEEQKEFNGQFYSLCKVDSSRSLMSSGTESREQLPGIGLHDDCNILKGLETTIRGRRKTNNIGVDRCKGESDGEKAIDVEEFEEISRQIVSLSKTVEEINQSLSSMNGRDVQLPACPETDTRQSRIPQKTPRPDVIEGYHWEHDGTAMISGSKEYLVRDINVFRDEPLPNMYSRLSPLDHSNTEDASREFCQVSFPKNRTPILCRNLVGQDEIFAQTLFDTVKEKPRSERRQRPVWKSDVRDGDMEGRLPGTVFRRVFQNGDGEQEGGDSADRDGKDERLVRDEQGGELTDKLASSNNESDDSLASDIGLDRIMCQRLFGRKDGLRSLSNENHPLDDDSVFFGSQEDFEMGDVQIFYLPTTWPDCGYRVRVSETNRRAKDKDCIVPLLRHAHADDVDDWGSSASGSVFPGDKCQLQTRDVGIDAMSQSQISMEASFEFVEQSLTEKDAQLETLVSGDQTNVNSSQLPCSTFPQTLSDNHALNIRTKARTINPSDLHKVPKENGIALQNPSSLINSLEEQSQQSHPHQNCDLASSYSGFIADLPPPSRGDEDAPPQLPPRQPIKSSIKPSARPERDIAPLPPPPVCLDNETHSSSNIQHQLHHQQKHPTHHFPYVNQFIPSLTFQNSGRYKPGKLKNIPGSPYRPLSPMSSPPPLPPRLPHDNTYSECTPQETKRQGRKNGPNGSFSERPQSLNNYLLGKSKAALSSHSTISQLATYPGPRSHSDRRHQLRQSSSTDKPKDESASSRIPRRRLRTRRDRSMSRLKHEKGSLESSKSAGTNSSPACKQWRDINLASGQPMSDNSCDDTSS